MFLFQTCIHFYVEFKKSIYNNVAARWQHRFDIHVQSTQCCCLSQTTRCC